MTKGIKFPVFIIIIVILLLTFSTPTNAVAVTPYVILDPGHGGDSPGAPSTELAELCGVPTNLNEKDITLDIAGRVRDILQAQGVRVGMTRDSDTNPSLQTRTNYINQELPNLAVSIHTNSGGILPDGTFVCGSGVEAFYSSIGPGGLANPNIETSRQLAQRLALKINQILGLSLRRNNGIEDAMAFTPGGLHMVREPVVPSALIEMAFISNPTEASLLQDQADNFAQAIAQAIMESVSQVPPRSGGPDYFGYAFKDSNTVSGPTYEWIDIKPTGTMILPNSDDLFMNGIPVGFFFNFYGTDYSQVSITNNGIVLASGGTSQYTNQPIGRSTPHNFISPFWDDIVTWNSAGEIYYQTIGTAPNRKFVVEWFDNQHYSSSPSGITFEAILYEGTNDIKFQYKDVDFGQTYNNNGASATVGIEGNDGRGLQYSYNEPVLSPNLAILFKFPAFSGTNMYLSKNAPASMDHGNTMTYTLYYNNFGSTIASNVVLEDTLPSNVEFVSASDGGTYNSADRKVTWNIGSVSVFPSGRGSRIVTVRIPATVPVGTVIQNTASISTTTLETRYDDNSATASTTVTGTTLPPDVSISGVVGNSGGTPSVVWHTPITFSFYSRCSGVLIDIIYEDGTRIAWQNVMIETSPDTFTYTTTFTRSGRVAVTYTVLSPFGCGSPSSVEFNLYIDPAGYIYDANTGERIAGASVWLQRPDGSGGWENVPTLQTPAIMQPDVNPLITGADGQYQWDVLEGSYRVHVEATGYYPVDSIMVSIPPPVTDLHVGLTHLPDSTPPMITNIGATSDINSAVITWDTDEASDSLVKYGASSGSYTLSESSSNMVLSHSVSLTGLTSDTLYYYVVNSTDGSQNSAQSIEHTFRTEASADTTSPVIESITLYPVNATAGSNVNIRVGASDDRGVVEVTANGNSLTNLNGFWNGSFTAPSTIGSYTVTIRASDAATNFAERTADYNVVAPTGSLGVGVAPKTTTASISGTTLDYTIKIKSMQNFDDIVRVNITMDGFPASYQMPLGWFDWNNRTVYVPSNSVVSLPLRLTIPPGQAAGRKAFKVRANSTLWITTAYDSGVITIS